MAASPLPRSQVSNSYAASEDDQILNNRRKDRKKEVEVIIDCTLL